MKVLITVLYCLGLSSIVWQQPTVSYPFLPFASSHFQLQNLNARMSDWKLSLSKGNINIYTRPNPDSGIKEVRITTEIKSTLTGLMTILGDVQGYTDWVYKCSASKRLKTISEQEFYYYTQTDMPFIIKDRDLVVHSKQWQDPNGVVHSRSSAVPNFIPAIDNMVRVKYFESNWKITPYDDGTLTIDYTVKTDPGGNIPVWIINLAVTKGPLNTMEKLIENVQQEKYQKAENLGYIKEK